MGPIFQQEDKTNMLAAAIKKHGACFPPMFPDMCLKTRPVTLWLWRFSAGNEDIMECMVGWSRPNPFNLVTIQQPMWPPDKLKWPEWSTMIAKVASCGGPCAIIYEDIQVWILLWTLSIHTYIEMHYVYIHNTWYL
jgi:hypothetical protein